MVAKIEFKLQCPSCEAQVPVRDRKLIGRKIDCPKCKYRFVVKDPEAEAEDDPKGKNGKGKLAKGKAGKGDGEGKTKKKETSKRTLYMGLGLGLAAVVLLGLVAFLMFGSSGDPPRPKVPPPPPGAQGQQQQQQQQQQQPVVPAAQADFTNLLPNDTEAVVSLQINRLLESRAPSQILIDGPGGFGREGFARTFGFSLEDVKRLVLASNESAGWEFNVISTLKPIKLDDLKTRLALKPAKNSPISGLDYFLINRDVGSLGRLLFHGRPKPLALHQVDDTTLVLANVEPMEKFLEAKGRPTLKTQPPAQAGTPPPKPAEPTPGQPAPEQPPLATPSYLTLDPLLKSVLDRIEEAKEPVIWSMATLRPGNVIKQNAGTLHLDIPAAAAKQIKDVRALGFALESMSAEKMPLSLLVEFQTEDLAKAAEKLMRGAAAPMVVQFLHDQLKMPAFILDEQGNLPAGTEAPTGPYSKIIITQKDKSATLKADLTPTPEMLDAMVLAARPIVLELKGQMDMATGQPRVHDLAAAVKAYADKKGHFPRGTLERKPSPERGGLPWRPDQRLSWLVELLPFLGDGEYSGMYKRIDPDRSWRDPENRFTAMTLVPHFLAAGSTKAAWWITYPGLNEPVAATNYAGIAGVGLDAASPDFAALDPDAEKKIGVIGYDRVTRVEDIKDGLANTIVMIRVPFLYKTPWLAGGGSTVRGVPEKGSVQPFVCVTHEGKPGTFAIMADGQVRFIPEDIPDDKFKALCTINGGEKIDNLDALAPIVPGSTKTELKPMLPGKPGVSGKPAP